MDKIQIKNFLNASQTVRDIEHFENDFILQGISIDSRTISPGNVFVAIKGEHFNGHRFVNEALQKGAKAIVVNESQYSEFQNIHIPTIRVEDTTFFLMEIAGWYRSQFQMPVLGLTGSAGKTTTKELLSSIFQTELTVVSTKKNMNNYIGVSLMLLELTKETQFAIIEMGTNRPGEIEALSKIVQPTQALITNIGSGHIGFFGTQQRIYEEKIHLFDGLKRGSSAFVNMEDPFLSKYIRSDLNLKQVGLKSNYDYVGKVLAIDNRGRVSFSLNNLSEIQLKIPGIHQLINGMLAASVGLEMGFSPEHIKNGIESVEAPDKRMEMFNYKGFLIINDAYNSNPESLRAAIDFLYHLPCKNGAHKFLLVGDMLELGELSEQAHLKIGEYLNERPFDYVFCIGEYSKLISEAIVNQKISTSWFPSHKELAVYMEQYLKPSDIVMLKGSRGMTMEKVLQFLGIGR
jgi:UDP-N-acetylmuramoyl-tripeptide--D-alanyl-D-alanine ligase